jgi:hypothetical protein
MDAAMMVRENRPNTTLWLIGLELSYSSIIQAMDNNVNRDVRFTTRARPRASSDDDKRCKTALRCTNVARVNNFVEKLRLDWSLLTTPLIFH